MSEQLSMLAGPAEAGPPPRVDACSCRKPAGAWGDAGWHWVLADEHWLDRQVLRDIAALEGATFAEIQAQTAASRERWSVYLNTAMAVERCPQGCRR